MTCSVADLMPASSPSWIFEDLDLVAVLLGPARVHAHQHRGPVLAFGAAGAGMDFDDRRRCRRPRRRASSRSGGARPRRASALQRRLGLGDDRRRRPRPRRARSARPGRRARARAARRRRSGSSSCWRSRITFCARSGEFQRLGSSAAAFSSARRVLARSQSKMPPQQADRLLDLVDDRLDFGAHLPVFCHKIERTDIAGGCLRQATVGLLT